MSASQQGACITLGNFDGVHSGHQSLIMLAQQIANAGNLDLRLLTFWPHPREILKGEGSHRPLTGRKEKYRLLSALGVKHIREIAFTPELSRMSAEEFVANELAPHNLQELVIGHDFTLGRNREGDAAALKQLGAKYGFHVSQAPPYSINGQTVSSTALRKYILDGNVACAARMLGRFYSLGGRVGHGFGRGEGLGFPTANLLNPDTLVPCNGVYATFAKCAGTRYQAVTNIGTNPTFGNQATSIETFFLDAAGDFYGEQICLEFVALLRHERKFASPADLIKQINLDIRQARTILASAQYKPDA